MEIIDQAVRQVALAEEREHIEQSSRMEGQHRWFAIDDIEHATRSRDCRLQSGTRMVVPCVGAIEPSVFGFGVAVIRFPALCNYTTSEIADGVGPARRIRILARLPAHCHSLLTNATSS